MFFLIAVISNPIFIEVKQSFYLQNLTILVLDALVFFVLMSQSAITRCETVCIQKQPFILCYVGISINDTSVTHLA